jgi:hypothetical protein
MLTKDELFQQNLEIRQKSEQEPFDGPVLNDEQLAHFLIEEWLIKQTRHEKGDHK